MALDGNTLEWRFRPRGMGRFFSAAFLAVWLCGWAAGEAFALFVLGKGLAALVTQAPVTATEKPLQVAPAMGVGAFLLVWLTLWTIGGP